MIATALARSTMYAIFATPIYRANLLLQIEDSAPDSRSFLTDTTGLGEIKTSASGEIQVLGSRMVLGPAVDQVRLHLNARPRYLPLVGEWLARRATALSEPGFLLGTGHVTGTERIGVDRFTVPALFEDTTAFVVTTRGAGRFTVEHELLASPLTGQVGVSLRHSTSDGAFEILVSELSGRPGAAFEVTVASRLRTIERLLMSEQGRQSNVVNVALEDGDRVRLADTLNAIADAYVRQNVDRKSAEAEKTLAFLNAQLPVFERQLRASEDAFARFRNQHGTIAFDEEAKVWLKSTANLQTSVLKLQQTRLEIAIDDAIHCEIRPNLDALAPGRFSNPTTDFFELAFFARLVDSLAAKYDHVVIDGPPLLAASDALAMAPACGCALIVARHGVTTLRELDDGMRKLSQVGVSPHGVVLNAVRAG